MREEKIRADRLAAFSDAVFAVIVTILVLEFKTPNEPTFSALWPLWPTICRCDDNCQRHGPGSVHLLRRKRP
jgi:hypothetical protein